MAVYYLQDGRNTEGVNQLSKGGECRCKKERNLFWFCNCLSRPSQPSVQNAWNWHNMCWQKRSRWQCVSSQQAISNWRLHWHCHHPTPSTRTSRTKERTTLLVILQVNDYFNSNWRYRCLILDGSVKWRGGPKTDLDTVLNEMCLHSSGVVLEMLLI